MAASILASIFFNMISSLTPSLPYSADSVRPGPVVFAVLALSTFSARRSALSSLVRASIFSSAASRRAVSYFSMEWSGVCCAGGFFYYYSGVFNAFDTWISPAIYYCILCCFANVSA
jgi:hypothetical protein